MARKKTGLPPYVFEGTKEYEISGDLTESLTKDIQELSTLGFEVPMIRLRGEAAVLYDLTPPDMIGMHIWRQRLEKAGFEVVSRLKPEELGFSASRRAVQGEGWK